jgi:nitroimidazol reductase NimA-like FMN-containing flavoprotein (pyridoxamine 5'-phosphate oxidase superfamily)
MPWRIEEGFDLEAFLARPLVARLATSGPNGPRVRPLWYLWEDGAFWWLTGAWSKLAETLAKDARVALVVDVTDVETGEVKGVTATGDAEIVPFDPARAKRKLARYLGPDETLWDPRFRSSWDMNARTRADDEPTGLGRLVPRTLRAGDSSFKVVR